MRVVLPAVTSQRVLFQQQFHNISYVLGSNAYISGSVSVDNGLDLSGGGYVRYSSYGADAISYLNQWTITVDVIVPAFGSAMAIVTCGAVGIGNRFELGISATGKMYATGTTTIESSSAITTGRHELMWMCDSSVIEFWCDGVMISGNNIALSDVAAPFIFIGIASDGVSRPFPSTIYNLTVDMDSAITWIWTPEEFGARRLFDFGAEYTNAIVGGKASTLYDQANSPHNATQGTSSLQSTLTTAADMNNRLVLSVAQDRYVLASGLNSAEKTHSFYFVGKNSSTTTYQFLISIGAYAMLVTSSSGQAGHAITRSYGAGTTPSGLAARVWFLDNATSKGTFYGPSGAIGVTASYTGVSINNLVNPATLFQFENGTSGVVSCLVGRIVCVEGTPNADDRTKWFNWCASYYGVTT